MIARGALALAALLAALLAGSLGQAAQSDATYFEEGDAAVTWTGSWSTNPLAANSGGTARLAMDAGATASFVFNGPRVSWIGLRDEWCGNADVSVDGVHQATVDTYSSPAQARAAIYTVSGLGPGQHTLTIQALGTHNPASAGAWVWVDAFSLRQEPAAPLPSLLPSALPPASAGARRPKRRDAAAVRFEQDDPALRWTGAWSSNSLAAHGGRSARLSMEASSNVTLTFEGTGVRWIGYRDEWAGIADVSLDGQPPASVDTYSAPATPQAVLYAIDGLPAGTHSLVISPTGRHRTASGGSWIWVDAFLVTR
jgi:hypothetical protein